MPSSLDSRMGALMPLVTCFLSLFIIVPAAALVIMWDDPGFEKKIVFFFLIPPILFLFAIWQGYYKIKIEDGQVQLRSIFRRETFFLDHISGYALTSMSAKGQQMESLNIGLKDGQFYVLNPQYYRNYPDIKAALTHGKSPDPVVKVKAIKLQKWREFITYAFIFMLAGGMMFFVMGSLKIGEIAAKDQMGIYFTLLFGIGYLGWKYRQYVRLPKE